MSKVSIMYRNIVQTTKIGRFEKIDKKKRRQKKTDFQTSELRSRSKNWETDTFVEIKRKIIQRSG